MSPVSAAVRLRNKVTAIPGTCILVAAGYPDRIIKFQKLPESLKVHYINTETTKGRTVSEVDIWPVMVNLDRGPDQEAWSAAKRDFLLSARRDRPVPEPLPVAENSNEEWAVGEEDVPVVENALVSVSDMAVTCEVCAVDFKTEHALKIHKGRTKH